MAKRRKFSGPCAYCGENATEIEHVIARQFFHGEAPQKHDIPRIPTCKKCNQSKQKGEDLAGVLLSLTSGDASAAEVIENRIPRTLEKNQKLKRKLQEKMSHTYTRNSFGKFESVAIMELTIDDQNLLREFYEYLVRGLFYFIFGSRLNPSHTVSIFSLDNNPISIGLLEHVRLHISLSSKSFALGEFRIEYALSNEPISSLWIISFRDTNIYSITHNMTDPKWTKILEKFEWKRVETSYEC